MMDSTLRIRLLLAMQTALLGRIIPNIRAVSCGVVGGDIKIKVIFDGAVSDLGREMIDEVGSEVASHFEDANVDVECVRMDVPQKIRDKALDWYVYLRKE